MFWKQFYNWIPLHWYCSSTPPRPAFQTSSEIILISISLSRTEISHSFFLSFNVCNSIIKSDDVLTHECWKFKTYLENIFEHSLQIQCRIPADLTTWFFFSISALNVSPANFFTHIIYRYNRSNCQPCKYLQIIRYFRDYCLQYLRIVAIKLPFSHFTEPVAILAKALVFDETVAPCKSYFVWSKLVEK